MNSEIAVRGYVVNDFWQYEKTNHVDIPYSSRVFVFDTETTTDQYQNLKIGYYEIYDDEALVDRAIFYDINFITSKELLVLENSECNIIPVREFVERIFLPEIYSRQTLCVGFNLPFDLSRLAINFGHGRKTNRGSFSLKLTENKEYPRLLIKTLDSTKSFIKFGTTKQSSFQMRGNFLDLRTISFSLSNQKHSLESACIFFKSKIKKLSNTKHGKVTKSYIKYNIQDVKATYYLYLKLVKEYKKYNLSKPITKIFSPASIGKSLLDEMRISPFSITSNISKQTLGYLMTTFYGGRTEVRIRKIPIKIKYLDFLSMYPTVCILQNLWSFVIANQIDEQDYTKQTREFVRETSLDDLQDPKIWRELAVIVGIKADSDILPVRARYGNKHSYNIGINHVTYDGILWYALSDVLASKILTGKSPEVIKAIRFVPKGNQNLRKITILDEKINPYDDIFKKIIEKRQELKDKKDPREHILKIIANSTSYGIYAQINTEYRKSKVKIYGLDEYFTEISKTETRGEWFNPILVTLITSASRLILAMVESILAKHGKMYAFCDTDSMAIPSEMADIIQNYFQKLNPYSFDKALFKQEDENFIDGVESDLLFYGISSKRYVLYNIVNKKITIRKHSSHGLGHIKNPYPTGDWEKEFWMNILDYHYKNKSISAIEEKYSEYFAISQLTVSTPLLISRFRKINHRKPFSKKIKPYNFCLVGFGNNSLKPVCPYRNVPSEAVYDEFIDYTTGKTHCGQEYWKELRQIFWDYLNHQESKFVGNNGVLQRRHIKVDRIIVIGKESNSLEESEILGLDENSYQIFENQSLDIEKIIQNLTPKEAKSIGISKNQLYRMNKSIRDGTAKLRKKTIKKLKNTIA